MRIMVQLLHETLPKGDCFDLYEPSPYNTYYLLFAQWQNEIL